MGKKIANYLRNFEQRQQRVQGVSWTFYLSNICSVMFSRRSSKRSKPDFSKALV